MSSRSKCRQASRESPSIPKRCNLLLPRVRLLGWKSTFRERNQPSSALCTADAWPAMPRRLPGSREFLAGTKPRDPSRISLPRPQVWERERVPQQRSEALRRLPPHPRRASNLRKRTKKVFSGAFLVSLAVRRTRTDHNRIRKIRSGDAVAFEEVHDERKASSLSHHPGAALICRGATRSRAAIAT